MSEKPQEFTIRTLRDIYELPTEDMMRRCMRELAADMLVMRRTNAVALAIEEEKAQKEKRKPVKFGLRWPDEIIWRDDNGGTSNLSIQVAGNEILTIDVTHKKHRKRKDQL